MKDEDQVKFYDLADEIESLCHQRGELSLTAIEKMAVAQEVRPTAILDELAMRGLTVRLSQGRVNPPGWPFGKIVRLENGEEVLEVNDEYLWLFEGHSDRSHN